MEKARQWFVPVPANELIYGPIQRTRADIDHVMNPLCSRRQRNGWTESHKAGSPDLIPNLIDLPTSSFFCTSIQGQPSEGRGQRMAPEKHLLLEREKNV